MQLPEKVPQRVPQPMIISSQKQQVLAAEEKIVEVSYETLAKRPHRRRRTQKLYLRFDTDLCYYRDENQVSKMLKNDPIDESPFYSIE